MADEHKDNENPPSWHPGTSKEIPRREWSTLDIRFTLTDDMNRHVIALARQHGCTLASICRDALADHLAVDRIHHNNARVDEESLSKERKPGEMGSIKWSNRSVRVRIPPHWEEPLLMAAANQQTKPPQIVRDALSIYLSLPLVPHTIGLDPIREAERWQRRKSYRYRKSAGI